MPGSTHHRTSRRIQAAPIGTLAVFALTTPAASAEPNVATSCGASFATELPGETYQQALARMDGYYDGLESVQVFYSGLPRMWPGKLDTSGRPMISSFKADPIAVMNGAHDTYLRDWFPAAPRDQDIYWTYFHEPENDIEDSAFTAEQFRLAWQHIANLAAQVDDPDLHTTFVLVGWSTSPASGRTSQDYFPAVSTSPFSAGSSTTQAGKRRLQATHRTLHQSRRRQHRHRSPVASPKSAAH